MSHFFTVVILPKDIQECEIDNKIEELMAPYDEQIEVPKYPELCYCVGSQARKEVREKVDVRFGKLEDARNLFWERHSDKSKRQSELYDLRKDSENKEEIDNELEEINNFLDEKWQEEAVKDRVEYYNQLLESHPLKDHAASDCGDCNGTGMVFSTYNPKSKWDWYVVGGRWDGEIQNCRRPETENGFNFSDQHHKLKWNTTKVKNMIENNVIPFVIVTPEGEWIERGEMGWWAKVSNEKDKDNWKLEVINIYNKYSDHIAIGLDCHI